MVLECLYALGENTAAMLLRPTVRSITVPCRHQSSQRRGDGTNNVEERQQFLLEDVEMFVDDRPQFSTHVTVP